MSVLDRLAGAPISWGVCEVPGWGLELPRERVLREMASLNLAATELGSAGYLPDTAVELGKLLESFGLTLAGGFVPLVLHDPTERDSTLKIARESAQLLSAAGARAFITAAVTSWDWAPRHELGTSQWSHVVDMLAAVDEIVAEHEMTQALHSHLGTIIENDDEVRRILDSSDVAWTLDTGHMMIGGTNPIDFISEAFERIEHVHLKDVRLELAKPVIDGEKSIMQGVQSGMFCNLGQGDVPIDETIIALESAGYDQWYVLEQDAAITDGLPVDGSGPILDVQASIEFIRTVEAQLASSTTGDDS